ncbi:hypothetical protein AMTRI_Chr08g163110 [Amborella trichopoda]
MITFGSTFSVSFMGCIRYSIGCCFVLLDDCFLITSLILGNCENWSQRNLLNSAILIGQLLFHVFVVNEKGAVKTVLILPLEHRTTGMQFMPERLMQLVKCMQFFLFWVVRC